MQAHRARTAALWSLGAWLAARGVLATVGLAIAALCAIASVVVAFAISADGGVGAAQLPTVASSAIAWSAGVMLAFGAALRALRRDREQGVIALVRARGGSVGGYVWGRVGGLSLVLAIAVGGATLVAGLAATSIARPSTVLVRASAAALVYALAFAATVGPVAMASLGARTRAGGYFTLLAVLAVPELLSPWTAALLPRGWHELTSIPAALSAVRSGIAYAPAGAAHAARALGGLAAVVAISLVVVATRVVRGDAGDTT